MRPHRIRIYAPETARERLLREWRAARNDREKARIVAQWIELVPDPPAVPGS